MQILTKNLVLVSKSNPASVWQSVWGAYTRRKTMSTPESTEVAVIRFSSQPAKEVTMDVFETDHKLFSAFGSEMIKGILNKWVFRQQTVLSVKVGDDTKKGLLSFFEDSDFKYSDGKWRMYKPDPHYIELFLLIGGMCGLLFGRFFPMPIVAVAIGFVIGLLIGYPMEKKYKEEIYEQRIDH